MNKPTPSTALMVERDHWQKIAVSASREREHNANVAQAMTAERDQLRAEVERLNALGSWAHTCIHHNDEQRAKAKGCPVCATAERDQLRAEVERYKFLHQCESDSSVEGWGRAKRAEAELATAKERLRSEAMDDYAAIKDLQRELATEREIVRVLKLDKDRLDWWNGESYYQFSKSHKCMNPGWWWSCGFDQIQGKSGIKNIRDAIDSAMAHSKSGRNKYNVCKRIEKSETEGAK